MFAHGPDHARGRREGLAASAGREVRQHVLAFLGPDCRVSHGHFRNWMPACLSMLLRPTMRTAAVAKLDFGPWKNAVSQETRRLDLNQRPLAPQASAIATQPSSGLPNSSDSFASPSSLDV